MLSRNIRVEHLAFLNAEHGGGCNRGRRCHASRRPARQPSPKKSPGPRIATTASLPVSCTTVSFMPPSRMYMTFLAGPPCEKTVSFLRKSTTFLPRPVESRNRFTSNWGLLELVFLRELRALTGLRLTSEDTIFQNSVDFLAGSILDSLCRGGAAKERQFPKITMTSCRFLLPPSRKPACFRTDDSRLLAIYLIL